LGTPCEDVREHLRIATAAGHCDRLTSQRVGGGAVTFTDGPVAGEHTQQRRAAAEIMFIDRGERVLQQLSGLRVRYACSDPPRPCDGRLGQHVGRPDTPGVLYGPGGGLLCPGDVTECTAGLVLGEEQAGPGCVVRSAVPFQQPNGALEVRYRVLVGELLERPSTGSLGPHDCLSAATGTGASDEMVGEHGGLGLRPGYPHERLADLALEPGPPRAEQAVKTAPDRAGRPDKGAAHSFEVVGHGGLGLGPG
jgi:hypothetical protein